jgi:CRP-like cAMP-binding protein
MEASERAVFLRKIHLFHDLTDDQLVEIAEKITEVSFDTDGVILEQGDVGDSFYLIYSGKVRVFRQRDGRKQELATLVSGDYVGEMELFTGRGRSATVTAMEPATLFRLSKEEFHEILEAHPGVKLELDIAIESRKLARAKQFKWLGPNEVVYFSARKSKLFLMEVLIVPVLTLLIPAILFIWGYLAQSLAAAAFGAVALALVLGWIAWRILDWGNDYYIVTNQRVVWLEKVIGLYDSRTEAPLSEILSVGVETDIVGRALDHGNVLVRTFVGAIPFKHVHHPHQAAHMVEEYWHRTQKASEQTEKEAFKDALRQRLGLLHPPQEEKAPPKEEKKAAPKRPNFLKLFIINLFKQRIEAGDVITYRKHLFVLLKQVFMPSAILLALLGLTMTRLYALASDPDQALIQTLSDGTRSVDTVAVSLPLLMIPVFLWWVYQYIDWTNDIFRVTSDQIYDIDKKPFGSEQSRAAPLDNILGTRYERIGFLGYILNFGTVYIDVGSTQFAFEDVLDPAIVQTDIDRRRLKRISDKKASERIEERNRMADWMASYHQNVDEFRREQELRDTGSKTE